MAFQADKFNITYRDTQGGAVHAVYTPTTGSSGDDFVPASKSGTAANDVSTDNYFPADVVPEQGLRVTVIAQTSSTQTQLVVAEGMVVRKGAYGTTGATANDTSWTFLVDRQTLDIT